MTYEEKYNELVELSHSENSEIKEKADAWLIGIGLQGAAELKVSAFLLDLAIRNVKGEITLDEVSQLLDTNYANIPKTETKRSHGMDGDYEVIPSDSPRIKEIEEYNRELRPALYAELDKKRKREELFSGKSSDKLIFVNIKNSYEAMQRNDRKHLLYRSSLYDCTRKYWPIKEENFDVATHILGCYKGKVIEVIVIKNRYIEPSGVYAGRKVFEGVEQPESPYMGMDLHEIFDTLANFRVKYWNIRK
ncbi:MAG: antitoxin VbhA family protein [Muribaculaceae bacterium]|nr:antitoxin VbhA family protein [Muribaculaceae bacterium]